MSGVPLYVDGENAFETVNNKANRATRGFIVGLIKDWGRIDRSAGPEHLYGTYSHMASLVKVDILGYYPGIEKKLPYTNSFLKELLFNFYNVSKYVLHIYVHIKRPSQNGYFFSIEKYIKITTIGLNILFIYSPMPALGDRSCVF